MFLFCCLLIGAAIAGLILVPRHLRHSALHRLGWFWNDKPDLSITAGLNLPPVRHRDEPECEAAGDGKIPVRAPLPGLRYSSDF